MQAGERSERTPSPLLLSPVHPTQLVSMRLRRNTLVLHTGSSTNPAHIPPPPQLRECRSVDQVAGLSAEEKIQLKARLGTMIQALLLIYVSLLLVDSAASKSSHGSISTTRKFGRSKARHRYVSLLKRHVLRLLFIRFVSNLNHPGLCGVPVPRHPLCKCVAG